MLKTHYNSNKTSIKFNHQSSPSSLVASVPSAFSSHALEPHVVHSDSQQFLSEKQRYSFTTITLYRLHYRCSYRPLSHPTSLMSMKSARTAKNIVFEIQAAMFCAPLSNIFTHKVHIDSTSSLCLSHQPNAHRLRTFILSTKKSVHCNNRSKTSSPKASTPTDSFPNVSHPHDSCTDSKRIW